MHELKILKIVLHILDNNTLTPILSVKELEPEKETCEFLEKHLAKILEDGDLKRAKFQQENNEIFTSLKNFSTEAISFIELTHQLAGSLFEIMKQNPTIPAADVAFTLYEIEKTKYLSLMKLNYKNSYIHYVLNTEEGSLNQIVKQRTTLPNENQKVEEGFIINLSTLELSLLEKQYEIDGEREFYLSKRLLKCNSDLSALQKLKIIEKAGNKITKKYFDEDFNKATKLKNVICESLEEASEIEVDKVAKVVFGENQDIQKAYLDEVNKAGLAERVISVPEKVSSGKKYTTQKVKTDSGIEINFPAHVYNNKDIMEFINNPDGTISILIKNVNKVTNR